MPEINHDSKPLPSGKTDTVKKHFSLLIQALTKPIVEEFPFFLFFFVTISLSSSKALAFGIIHWQVDPLVFVHLSRGLALFYLFTAVVFVTKSRAVKTLLYILCVSLFALELFLWLVFHLIIGPQIITFVGETNPQEATEFLHTYLFSTHGLLSLALTLAMIVLICMAERQRERICNWLRKAATKPAGIVTGLALLGIIAYGFVHFDIYYDIAVSKSIDDLPIRDPLPYDIITRMAFSLHSIRTTNAEIHHAIYVAERATKGTIEERDSLNVVFIIGESYIKRHSNLYGYPLPTCPNLTREREQGNLFVFDNVTTPSAGTTLAMKNMLCCNSLGRGEKWPDYPFFPTIFKKSGFNVYYWDIQRRDTSQGLYVFSLNSFLFNETIQRISYTATTDKRFDYDGQLVSDYEQNVQQRGKYNLIIFHLWGQHVDAAARYPHGKRFTRFTSHDEEGRPSYVNERKKQDIAHYDNATYYNDYVVERILNLYKDENTVVIYLSDHGEEMYDYRDSKGRVGPAKGHLADYLKCQFNVPFMIWCSDKYQAAHPEMMRDIRSAIHRPFTTDNVSNVLFRLSSIRTRYYHAECDVTSSDYKPQKRMTGNGFDYDKGVTNVKN